MSISSSITEGHSAPLAGAQMAKDTKQAFARRRPTHPGQVVRSNIDALGLSVNQAAIRMGIGRAALGKLVNEDVAVSPEMALRLGQFFRNGPHLWLRMQNEVDLFDAGQKIGAEVAAIEPADWEGREEFDE